MTKAELVNNVAERTGVDKRTALDIIEATMEEIKATMIKKENIYLRGFGTFLLKHRRQKTARNISKNTTIVVPAHDIPSFKPCSTFAEKVAK
ncbi:MAG: integration host factor subunit beta [Prevotella sp.]|nr:integration host factor subunit beta [Candidatus Equicola faecalis]MDO4819095.1 HU family DNA-binding protein [Prevotella sp.]